MGMGVAKRGDRRREWRRREAEREGEEGEEEPSSLNGECMVGERVSEMSE